MMVPREFVGKQFPPFKVKISEQLSRSLLDLTQPSEAEKGPSWPPPSNWPAVMILHGTACLINVWEELGVDPLEVFLSEEEFLHFCAPLPDEELTGYLRIEEIREFLDEESQICEEVDLWADFFNAVGAHLAAYRFSYRVRLTVPARGKNR
ncbi:MAG: hypothetical protein HY912_09145 [Desulfomonile tiedjei]|uniref:Uncharacterized protein n=1 Tax=Desulfomonile tiedjei TaxID=2358 RepID=A0A9D6V2P4_9BACT|nr:hypothetical protein [Desulfomonile tiedjei]